MIVYIDMWRNHLLGLLFYVPLRNKKITIMTSCQSLRSSSRPVVVLGAGILGRRISCIFAAAGYNVHIRDPSATALEDAVTYVDAHKATYVQYVSSADETLTIRDVYRGHERGNGHCAVFTDLEDAVRDAWLVIEAIPEKLDLKTDTFGHLDRLTPADCIFGTNSSSYKSSLMLDKVSRQRTTQMLNIHFSMPPRIRTVELMTDGNTAPEVMSLVKAVLEDCAMLPVVVSVESTGYGPLSSRIFYSLTFLSRGFTDGQLHYKSNMGRCKARDSAHPVRGCQQAGRD